MSEAKVEAVGQQGFRAGALAIMLSGLVAACGGGGSAAPATTTETVQSASTGTSAGASSSTTGSTSSVASADAVVAIDALQAGSNAFDFHVSATLNSETALNAAVGGTMFVGWNPDDAQTLLQPGMKVLFFGKANGCSVPVGQGPVARGDDAVFQQSALQSGLSGASSTDLRWVPSAATSACAASMQGELGPSMVQLNPESGTGAVGIYTDAQPASNSNFFGAYDASGQDGQGTNAFIDGSYVAFRQDWSSAGAVQPFAATSTARVVSTQTVGFQSVDQAAAQGGTMQAKQEITVTFINPTCVAGGITAQRPCQVQYLFNTAIYRTGVTDWSSVSWFANATVWYDPAQGGMPVIDGPVFAKGQTVNDGASGLPMFTSQGAATQHGVFANQNFDLRISFVQFKNVLALVVAKQTGKTVAQVTSADMAATWGSRWNDVTAWVLLDSEVGQEVYNPYATLGATLGGSFSQLYVGPQAS